MLLVFCMHRSPTGNLVPLDLEIEATLRRNRAERRRKLLQDRTIASILEEEAQSFDSTSSDSLSSRESAIYLPKASVVDDEHQQRVTLDDYSSSSVSQFFTSITRPEVQAHNINYPHSLIICEYLLLIHICFHLELDNRFFCQYFACIDLPQAT